MHHNDYELSFKYYAGQADGDLLAIEWNDIWEAAPKSPKDPSRVDVISFVQIYRDVDDLFEEEDEEDEEDSDVSHMDSTETRAGVGKETASEDNKGDDNAEDLSKIFKSICTDSGLISRDELKQWKEVGNLLEEGLLGEDEFDELWEKAANKDDGGESLRLRGFLDFNLALDDLFELEQEDRKSTRLNSSHANIRMPSSA